MHSENKIISLTVAPNGGRNKKDFHPNIPLTANALANTAAACLEQGAAQIHIHVRKADGSHLLDADAYNNAIFAIRHAVGDKLLIQITSESLGVYQIDEQINVIKNVKPEAVSLAFREFVPNPSCEKKFLALLAWMKQENVLPQIILYDEEDAKNLATLRDLGKLPWQDIPVLFVLGRYTQNQTSSPQDILPFLNQDMPKYRHWSVCAFGRFEASCVNAAALFGGHIRIGFENNIYLPNGSVALDNAALLNAAKTPLLSLGYQLHTAKTLRENIIKSLS